MDRRRFVISTVSAVVGALGVRDLRAQGAPIDLGALVDRNGLPFGNRTVNRITDGARQGVRVSAGPGEPPGYIPGREFSSGTIAVDLRGKNLQGQSFLGITFHGLDATTHDAVYFRPFNFKAVDPVGRSHAVQYISMPANPWQKLRAEQTGQFEHAVSPVPDPDGWFQARIVIANRRLSVFVDNATEPSLAVDLLNPRGRGLVGLWVGNGSGGDFANLSITNS